MNLPSTSDDAGIFAFAMSFDAYKLYESFEAAADVARRAPRSALEEVRAELFFKARAARHVGSDLHVKEYVELLPLLVRFTGGANP